MTNVPREIPKIQTFTKPKPSVEAYQPKKVLKFGGSSMQEGLHQVVEITSQNMEYRPIVVVSAIKGVTDALIALSYLCFEQIGPILQDRLNQRNSIRIEQQERPKIGFSKDTFSKGLDIVIRYCAAAEGLGFRSALIDKIMWGHRDMPPVGLQKQILEYLEDFDKYVSLFWNNASDRAANELKIDKNSMFTKSDRERLDKKTSEILLREARLYMSDKFVLWGEFPSQLLLFRKFQKDGKKVFSREPSDLGILTEMRVGGAVLAPNTNEEIRRKIKEAASRHYDLYVVGGYLAKGVEKREGFLEEKILMLRTTLGRGGSDLSAVAFGAALGIPVFLYSDTDGYYACDPRIYPNNKTRSGLSTAEALESANYGSKIFYVRSMEYALEHNVDVWSKNTFNPEHHGTHILKNPDRADWQPRTVKGISFLEQGDKSTLAVIGHDIGEWHEGVESIKGKLRDILHPLPLQNLHINTHSVTIDIPQALVKERAEQFYQAFCQ